MTRQLKGGFCHFASGSRASAKRLKVVGLSKGGVSRRDTVISAGVRNPVVRSGATMVRAYSPFLFCLSHFPGLRPGLAWVGPPALF